LTSNGSWQKVRFDEICKNVSDRIEDPKQAETDYYIGLEHLDSEDPKISRHGSPQDVGATKLKFKTGQILFGKRRWYLRKLAVAEREGICSAHMMVLESIDDKIKKEFLSILMQGEDFFEKALSVSAGSLSPTIKWKDLSTLEFLIPSIEQQENILSVMQKIDDSISNAQTLLEKTKNYMVSRCESLLTRGIGHTKFKKVPWYYGKTIEIPEEWRIKHIHELILSHKQGFYTNQKYTKKGIRLVTITDLHNPELDYDSMPFIELDKKLMDSFKVDVGDFLFARSGAIGRFGIATKNIPCVFASYIIRFKLNENFLLNNFLRFFLQTIFGVKQLNMIKQGGANININAENIKSMKLILPPIPEQKQIASILSNINEQITQQQSHLTNLKVLRKSILNSKLTKEKTNVTN
jgi:type I restriction enzyme, S subunit